MATVTADTETRKDDIAVVRQPILDTRRKVVGYQLNFSKYSSHSSGHDGVPNARATSALLLDVFGDLGLERLVGDYPAWMSVARDWLVEVGMPPLRPDRAVLQIESYPARDDLLATLQKLSRTGYTLALENFDGRGDLGDLLTLANTVKIPVDGRDDEDLRRIIAEPAKHGARLVATGVKTNEDFERCCAVGFTGFQGEFFSKPRMVRGRGVATAGVGALRTLGELTSGDVSFEDLERIIAADVGLSLKLLRYVNSAFFALPRTIGSVREALALLGTRTVGRWATVMALSSIPDVPHELIGVALQRARMCETLGGARLDGGDSESYFTVGLFSVADVLLDAPMEEVLDSLPFAEDIREALLHLTGPKGELLDAVLCYERGEFRTMPDGTADGKAIAASYREALEWAEEVGRGTS